MKHLKLYFVAATLIVGNLCAEPSLNHFRHAVHKELKSFFAQPGVTVSQYLTKEPHFKRHIATVQAQYVLSSDEQKAIMDYYVCKLETFWEKNLENKDFIKACTFIEKYEKNKSQLSHELKKLDNRVLDQCVYVVFGGIIALIGIGNALGSAMNYMLGVQGTSDLSPEDFTNRILFMELCMSHKDILSREQKIEFLLNV